MRAPGGPGAAPGWGPGRKQGFGAAPGSQSRVWFTLADGNLSEVFFPAVDRPILHGMRFIAAAPGMPPFDDAAESRHTVRWLEPGVPAFLVESEHPEYRLSKEYLVDVDGDAIVMVGQFRPELPDVRLYLQAALHEVGDGLVLEREPPTLAGRQGQLWLALVGPFHRCTVGYLNSSDLFVDLHDGDGVMTAEYDAATRGHVALGAELATRGGTFQLALGFGATRDVAEDSAHAALASGASGVRERLVRAWRARSGPDRNVLKVAGDEGTLALASTTVLRCLEDKQRPGAFVAAPGEPRGERGRTHSVVCNRDLFHIAAALLDAGDQEAAVRALDYLESTQREDGSWPLRRLVSGVPQADGADLGQAAFPILLAWRLGVTGALARDPYPKLVRRAASFLLATGPATEVDRWMDGRGGLSPSSLAAAIAAQLAAAEFASDAHEAPASDHLRAVADYWEEQLEAWTYLASAGRYVRLAGDRDSGPREEDPIGLEFLELVRRGLRRPDDPRIASSLVAADAALSVELACGRAWRHDPGDPCPGPVPIGERAHHALASGEPVAELVRRLEACAGPELLLPEHLGDGQSDGVAPFGWAHAEYLRLLSAFATSRQADVMEPARRRYAERGPRRPAPVWSHAHRIRTLPPGRPLRIQLRRRGTVLWTVDGWNNSKVVPARDTGLRCWMTELPVQDLPAGGVVEWTANYADGGWEGGNYRLTVEEPPEV